MALPRRPFRGVPKCEIISAPLSELQWLCHDGLFVVSPAAAETNRRREDNRASYKDTHGNPPSFVLLLPNTIYSDLSRRKL